VTRLALILAVLYWNAGVRTSKPSVCFVGDALTARPARVAQIKEWLKQYEQAANIRFDYKATCTSQTQADGTVFWTDDIRVVIPNTTAPGVAGDVYNAVKPVPGTNCPMDDPGGGGWSNSPAEYTANRPCLYNMHLGDDSFATAGFGDPSGGATPFVNHTLHEFGHALGLSHEHARRDVLKDRVLEYLDRIPNIDATEAQTLYDAGERSVAWIAEPKRPLAELQAIPGFASEAAAKQLRADAAATAAPDYGGGGTSYITPYDPLSVMHYTWTELQAIAPGNYANTGLSAYDRLALHILYPEDAKVAELIGKRVLRTGETLSLVSGWQTGGVVMPNVASNFAWKLNGTTIGTGTSVTKAMTTAGTFPLVLTHDDFLGRKYTYTGEVRVLTPADFTKKVLGALPY
jgi:hypothetical protein